MKKSLAVLVVGLALTLSACSDSDTKSTTPTSTTTGTGTGNTGTTTPTTPTTPTNPTTPTTPTNPVTPATVDKVVDLDKAASKITDSESGIGNIGDNFVPTAWTGGAGSIQGFLDDDDKNPIASGTINADGTFTVNLPANVTPIHTDGTLSTELLYTNDEYSCTKNTIVASDMTADFEVLDLKVVTPSRTANIANVDIKSTGNTVNTKAGAYVYTDRPWTLMGSADCTVKSTGIIHHTTYNASFSKGWNKLAYNITANKTSGSTEVSINLSTGAFPTNLWYTDTNINELGNIAQ